MVVLLAHLALRGNDDSYQYETLSTLSGNPSQSRLRATIACTCVTCKVIRGWPCRPPFWTGLLWTRSTVRGADNARSATHLRLRFPDDINLVSLLGASDCSKYVGYLRSSFNLPGKDNVGRSSGARRWGNAIAVIPCDARATYYDTLSPHTAFRSTLRRYMRSTSVLAVRPVSPPSHCFPPERLNFPIYY